MQSCPGVPRTALLSETCGDSCQQEGPGPLLEGSRTDPPCVPKVYQALSHQPSPPHTPGGQQCLWSHRSYHGDPAAGEHRGQDFRTQGGAVLTTPAIATSSPCWALPPARSQLTPAGTSRDRADPAQEPSAQGSDTWMLPGPVGRRDIEAGPSASLWGHGLGLSGNSGPICCSSLAHLAHSDRGTES